MGISTLLIVLAGCYLLKILTHTWYWLRANALMGKKHETTSGYRAQSYLQVISPWFTEDLEAELKYRAQLRNLGKLSRVCYIGMLVVILIIIVKTMIIFSS